MVFNLTGTAAEKDSRVYELRTYWAAAGKLDALNARFRNHTLKLFEKHGMVNIGYWMPATNFEQKLVYILAHPSREAAKKSWADFMADPEWKAAQTASEVNGRLVSRMESIFMKVTDFSPAVVTGTSGDPRLFELRTYRTPEGGLPALLARFQGHTLKLFKKHGMANYGYWVPMDKEKGSENTLIYLLAHKDQAAADAAWKAFRADPEWVAAKKASEVKGSLTRQVTWSFMKGTDYSPTK